MQPLGRTGRVVVLSTRVVHAHGHDGEALVSLCGNTLIKARVVSGDVPCSVVRENTIVRFPHSVRIVQILHDKGERLRLDAVATVRVPFNGVHLPGPAQLRGQCSPLAHKLVCDVASSQELRSEGEQALAAVARLELRGRRRQRRLGHGHPHHVGVRPRWWGWARRGLPHPKRGGQRPRGQLDGHPLCIISTLQQIASGRCHQQQQQQPGSHGRGCSCVLGGGAAGAA
mmetsp:Transcript_5343/g.12770  ORF Transcript_5343/g.12770 Transcript_5343/m.12770 type:complete len:228 (-) Transcript_5343:66-749(-)